MGARARSPELARAGTRRHRRERRPRLHGALRTGARPRIRLRAARHRAAPHRAAPTSAGAIRAFRSGSLSLLPDAVPAFCRAAPVRRDATRSRLEAVAGQGQSALALRPVRDGRGRADGPVRRSGHAENFRICSPHPPVLARGAVRRKRAGQDERPRRITGGLRRSCWRAALSRRAAHIAARRHRYDRVRSTIVARWRQRRNQRHVARARARRRRSSSR